VVDSAVFKNYEAIENLAQIEAYPINEEEIYFAQVESSYLGCDEALAQIISSVDPYESSFRARNIMNNKWVSTS
jgi:hypothetical protein